MEVRKTNGTAGVLIWTPAPMRATSPPSSAASEDAWEEEEEEEEAQGEVTTEDFESQMDENGIIGLQDALEDVELGEGWGGEGGESGAPRYSARAHGVEEPSPAGRTDMTGTAAPADMSHNLSNQWDSETSSHAEMPGGEAPVGVDAPSPATSRRPRRNSRSETLDNACGSGSVSPFSPRDRPVSVSRSPLPTAHAYPHLLHFSSEELAHAPGIEAETFPEGGFTESLPESSSSWVSQAAKPHWPDEADRVGLKHGRAGPYPTPAEVRAQRQSGIHEWPEDSSVMSLTSQTARTSPRPRKMHQRSVGASYSRTAVLNKDQLASPDRGYANITPGGGMTAPRESSPKTRRCSNGELDEVRRGPPSYCTPDFSKVEPRVHFPKSGYKPPKSKSSSRMRLSAEPPVIFKSPADIVKEVLFSADGLLSPPPPTETEKSAISTVPEDFRCPQQATKLVEQLQEDYNRLLTKYADAENTIDRLRLEAKVNLYSDPKRPNHTVQSRVTQEGSKVMTLSFPQAQRAVIGSDADHLSGLGENLTGVSPTPLASVTSSSSRGSSDSLAGQNPTRTLTKQAKKFLWQVQTFEVLLNSRSLEPFEHLKGLSQLVQGLDCLERGYLAARNEHRQLQRRVAEIGPFDPDRELEGLIFQCGTCVEELRVQTEQQEHGATCLPSPAFAAPRLTCLPSPAPQPTCLPSPPFAAPQPSCEPTESPEAAFSGETRGLSGSEVSSPRGESEGEDEGEGEDEEDAIFLSPEQVLDEADSCSGMDRYESFQSPPEPRVRTRDDRRSPRRAVLPGNRGRDTLYPPGGNVGAQTSLMQRRANSGPQDTSIPPNGNQRVGQSDPPPGRVSNNQSPGLFSNQPPRKPPSAKGLGPCGPGGSSVGRYPSSSLTSLAESVESENRSSKLHTRSRRVLSQDGLLSPETDSGFLGSDSVPAVFYTTLHQGASASVSLPQTRSRGGSLPGQRVPAPLTTTTSTSPPPPPPREPPTPEERGGGCGLTDSTPGQTRGQRNKSRRQESTRRASLAGSSQRRVGRTPLSSAGSGTSEFGPDPDRSNCESNDVDGEADGSAESCDSQESPPTASPYYRDHPHNVLGTGQVTNHSAAIVDLQAEVKRLKEKLESSLAKARRPRPPSPPPSPPSPPPSPPRGFHQPSTSTPRIRSGQSRTDVGSRQSVTAAGTREGSAARPTWRKRGPTAPPPRAQRHITAAERGNAAPQPQHHSPVPRRLDAQQSPPTDPRQPAGLLVGPSVTDEPYKSTSQCPRCLSQQDARAARKGEEVPVRRHNCARCGLSKQCLSAGTQTDHRGDPEPAPRGSWSSAHPDGVTGETYLAVPASTLLGSVVHCVALCHPPVTFCSCDSVERNQRTQRLCVRAQSAGRTTSEVRGRGEMSGGGGHRCLSCRRQQDSLNGSLNRAIRAARDMRQTSGRMVSSLTTGLLYQETLSQSCIF